ncbi:hypothetical protein [Bradyrhizobium pachyrhizi]|uniref:hypothetical protein n=1 Tax=Bradyrhizobium pachyrhizi TaxID=280333 RepID=UPI001FD016F5|nr:hypothetical protein [Bradyrhizobium pachyrhizi]
MGIAVDQGLLPAALQSVADIVVRIPAPDGPVLRQAISRFARRSPGELDPGIPAGLELPEIVVAFRPGTGAQAIARRLEAARRSHAGPALRVPALGSAVEDGEARVWGLDLARDLEDFRGVSRRRSSDRWGKWLRCRGACRPPRPVEVSRRSNSLRTTVPMTEKKKAGRRGRKPPAGAKRQLLMSMDPEIIRRIKSAAALRDTTRRW